MSSNSFEVVMIDFFGTVAAGDRHIVETISGQVARDFGLAISGPELAKMWGKAFFAEADGSNNNDFKTLIECEKISLATLMRDYGIDMDPMPYVRQVQEYFWNPPLHSDAIEAINRIPIPVCCVSNIDEDDLQRAISAHGLEFDHTVSSERARSYKPDEKIFRLTLAEMNVSAEKCMHVGDSLHSDIGGAQRVGITGVWIEREGRISDIGEAVPDHKIRSLLELGRFFK